MIRIKIGYTLYIFAGTIAICCSIWHLWDNVIYSDVTFTDVTRMLFWSGNVFYISPLCGIYEKYIEKHYKH